jgi:4-hydroxy-tetrahydrodipicolinate synthase
MVENVQKLSRGLWGILATPFSAGTLELDEASLRKEVQLFLGVPARGLVALGVFGEGVALDAEEQSAVVRAVADEAGDVPLVVGVSARTTAVAVEQAQRAVAAADRPLAGLMVQANSADRQVLSAHLHRIHDRTGTGVVLQDYPEASGVRISTATTLGVIEDCPFVVAVKSEAPPTAAAISSIAPHTDVPLFGGLGGVGLLDELAAGAAGAMTGFSHPEGLQQALVAWEEGGFPAARAAFSPWLPLVNFEAQPGIGLAMRKEILRRRGVFADGAVRPPARDVPEQVLGLMTAHLEAVAELAAVEDRRPPDAPRE